MTVSEMNETSFRYSGTELEALSQATRYYHWILSCFSPFLGKRVIEVGAGLGTFSSYLLNQTNISELIALEPADNLFPELQRRLAGNARVKLQQGHVEDLSSSVSADSVILVNVLEHIEDDDSLFLAAKRILVPGGRILLFVPALPWLFGALDEAFEHHRRYTKPRLGEKLRQAGYDLECLRYVNLLGVFTWFLAGRLLRRKTLRSSDVQLYDRWVVPWASWLERRWEPPIGQSLLAVGRK